MSRVGWRAAVFMAIVVLGACSEPDDPEEPRAPVVGDSADGCGGIISSAKPPPEGTPPSDDLVQEFTDSIKDEPWFNGAGLTVDESGYVLMALASEDPDLPAEFKGVRVKVCESKTFIGS